MGFFLDLLNEIFPGIKTGNLSLIYTSGSKYRRKPTEEKAM